MSDRNIRVLLAYDGTDFCGWQIQKSGRTVQGEIEAALEELHGHPVRITGAGRTDAGVHASGQVANFRTGSSIPTERFSRAMNGRLPRDVRVLSCVEAGNEFHARFSATRREYKYYLEPADVSNPFSRRYALTLKRCPPIRQLNDCAAVIEGTRDFTTFSAVGDQSRSKIRMIESAAFYVEDRFVVFRIIGNAFLWKMVRSLVGTILEACETSDPRNRFREALDACDRKSAGTTAPAKGLFLTRVAYE